MVPLAVEAAEQRKGPAAAGAQIPPSDYRVRKVRFLPSSNTNAGARDGSVALEPLWNSANYLSAACRAVFYGRQKKKMRRR